MENDFLAVDNYNIESLCYKLEKNDIDNIISKHKEVGKNKNQVDIINSSLNKNSNKLKFNDNNSSFNKIKNTYSSKSIINTNNKYILTTNECFNQSSLVKKKSDKLKGISNKDVYTGKVKFKNEVDITTVENWKKFNSNSYKISYINELVNKLYLNKKYNVCSISSSVCCNIY